MLSVLKRSVPKTLAFAFGSRLRSRTQRSKARVLGRRLPNGKPHERLQFRDLRGKTLAFTKKRIAIIFCVLDTSLGARACVQKKAAFCVCVLKPKSIPCISQTSPSQTACHKPQNPEIRHRKGTPKIFCDKDFAELSGELSGSICLKPSDLF